jgi:hypothetical protein
MMPMKNHESSDEISEDRKHWGKLCNLPWRFG